MSVYYHPASTAILKTLAATKPLTSDFGNSKSGPISFNRPPAGLQIGINNGGSR